MQEKQWLRVEEIAKELDFDPGTVRSWITSGKLPAAKFGKEYRVRKEDYEKFVQDHMHRKEE